MLLTCDLNLNWGDAVISQSSASALKEASASLFYMLLLFRAPSSDEHVGTSVTLHTVGLLESGSMSRGKRCALQMDSRTKRLTRCTLQRASPASSSLSISSEFSSSVLYALSSERSEFDSDAGSPFGMTGSPFGMTAVGASGSGCAEIWLLVDGVVASCDATAIASINFFPPISCDEAAEPAWQYSFTRRRASLSISMSASSFD
jgi:hypothetical protein